MVDLTKHMYNTLQIYLEEGKLSESFSEDFKIEKYGITENAKGDLSMFIKTNSQDPSLKNFEKIVKADDLEGGFCTWFSTLIDFLEFVFARLAGEEF
jgi:hypothetical protein